jgi:hypothetical protein
VIQAERLAAVDYRVEAPSTEDPAGYIAAVRMVLVAHLPLAGLGSLPEQRLQGTRPNSIQEQ